MDQPTPKGKDKDPTCYGTCPTATTLPHHSPASLCLYATARSEQLPSRYSEHRAAALEVFRTQWPRRSRGVAVSASIRGSLPPELTEMRPRYPDRVYPAPERVLGAVLLRTRFCALQSGKLTGIPDPSPTLCSHVRSPYLQDGTIITSPPGLRRRSATPGKQSATRGSCHRRPSCMGLGKLRILPPREREDSGCGNPTRQKLKAKGSYGQKLPCLIPRPSVRLRGTLPGKLPHPLASPRTPDPTAA